MGIGNTLQTEFEKVTYDDWVQAATTALKGRSPDKLKKETPDGLVIKPLFTAADWKATAEIPGKAPFTRGTVYPGKAATECKIRAFYAHPSIETVKTALRNDQKGGANSAHIKLNRAVRLGREPVDEDRLSRLGVTFFTAKQLAYLLEGELPEREIWFDCGGNGLVIAAMLDAALTQLGLDWGNISGGLGCDPLGALARDGDLPQPIEQSFDELTSVVEHLSHLAPNMKALTVSTSPYLEAGATITEELAFSLANAVELLRGLNVRKMDLRTVATQFCFELAVGSNILLEVAKVRALRRLWSTVLAACSIEDAAQSVRICVCSAQRSRTTRDPWVNLLRGTAEALVGEFSGADGVTILPFDSSLGDGNELGRRLARNTPLILQHEAHLDRVSDPAGGSWYVESLTEQIAKQAWSVFQEIEALGGMSRALFTGEVHRRLSLSAEERRLACETGLTPSVGVSVFPLLDEPLCVPTETSLSEITSANERMFQSHICDRKMGSELEVLAEAPPAQWLDAAIKASKMGATLGELRAALSRGVSGDEVAPLPRIRDAGRFEVFRDASDTYLKNKQTRPRAFLVNLGPLATHRVRSTWTVNFLAAGGIEALNNEGFETIEQAVEAFRASQSPVALVCSTDERIAQAAPQLVPALRQAGATLILLVGIRDKEQLQAVQKLGVDGVVHSQINAVTLLKELVAHLVGQEKE